MAGAASFENVILKTSMTVSGDNLSAATDKFIFVKCGNAADDVVPCDAKTQPLGISQEIAPDGDDIAIALLGISKGRLAGTVKRGNMLKPDGTTSGGMVVSTRAALSQGCMALQDGSSGDVVAVLLTPGSSGT